MATYAIGDVQGCYDNLIKLLDKIKFDEKKDKLLFCGDLINRGNKSLKTIRFIKGLGSCAKAVLGNHDLHCLVVANNFKKPNKSDTLNKIYRASDKKELLDYLRFLPFIYCDDSKNTLIVHAGIYPFWNQKQAFLYAKEAEKVLQSDDYLKFLKKMYGNLPNKWSDKLSGYDRLRFIVNSFTRMRYVSIKGKLDFINHNSPNNKNKNLYPWYELSKHKKNDKQIIFGHWATLKGYESPYIYGIDTGCVWNLKLSALQIKKQKDNVWHSINCKK
ncbi:MAG: diadenosine tetraphosphatase [Gammaproteobacteria bacterium]|nr:MAG: diadenosine tetraphosphatase [Gammaproteobacteria bacterium]